MGELWRSQEMQLVQLFVQIDAAHDTVDELGDLGLIQFRDLNPNVNAFQRNFVNQVKMADEMERKLRFFQEQIDKANEEMDELPPIRVETGEEPVRVKMDELEGKFEDLEKELMQMNQNQEMLNRNYNELIELKYVLQKDDNFFHEADFGKEESVFVEPDVEEGQLLLGSESVEIDPSITGGSVIKLGFITGVVSRAKFNIFERILFRATRGNLYMKFAEIEEDIKDPQTEERISKNVFIVFFQGERLHTKIKKICESFGANLYPCPETRAERTELLKQVNSRLEELNVVLARTREHRRQMLSNVAVHLESWQTKVLKEKSIYHTMNKFNYDLGRKCLIAEGWCPRSATEEVNLALRRGKDRSGALVPSIMSIINTKDQPPTYFKTNKFTVAFQEIVDAYGISRYGEVNPAVFTIVTFPFLFAVMFGDVGHGLLMFFTALYFVLNEKKLGSIKLNELVETVYDGRYVILLMGAFSIFTGFMYNEFFSVPMFFGSSYWEKGPGHQYELINENKTYPFGVDPVWKGNENELLYYNSLKMKLSIILGVTQMVLGIIIKLLNGIHFRKELDVFFEFIPQIIFMLSIFGYTVFLIYYKWTVPYYFNDKHNLQHGGPPVNETCYKNPGTNQAPVLLNDLIYMFLGVMTNNEFKCLYYGQFFVQMFLLIFAVIAVPVMLLPKPFILKRRAKRGYAVLVEHGEEGDGGDHEEFDFGEIMVHQIIETIEFVLGAISNTASYLRLWALSLAHSELATVFWEMLLVQIGLQMGKGYVSVPLMFLVWSIWFAFTIGVLMVMESLSAFLHALRLHWVEFQNKFYYGDGKKFAPFSYERILSGEDEEMTQDT